MKTLRWGNLLVSHSEELRKYQRNHLQKKYTKNYAHCPGGSTKLNTKLVGIIQLKTEEFWLKTPLLKICYFQPT